MGISVKLTIIRIHSIILLPPPPPPPVLLPPLTLKPINYSPQGLTTPPLNLLGFNLQLVACKAEAFLKLSRDGIVPPQSQPNPSISRLTADLTWILAQEPLHADIDFNKTNGVGPGMAFANAILTKDPSIGTVGLVPCAIGGTNISQWAKGGFLYGQLVRRMNAAVKGGGVIRGMLWYQGESDTMIEEDADAYKGRLIEFFKEIRADLNHPRLRIIQVGLASGEGPFVEEIRKAQLGIKLQNVESVDAKGLSLGSDRLHLTTPAQVHLGQMLADAFLHSSMLSIHATTDSSSLSTQICAHHFIFILLMFILVCF